MNINFGFSLVSSTLKEELNIAFLFAAVQTLQETPLPSLSL